MKKLLPILMLALLIVAACATGSNTYTTYEINNNNYVITTACEDTGGVDVADNDTPDNGGNVTVDDTQSTPAGNYRVSNKYIYLTENATELEDAVAEIDIICDGSTQYKLATELTPGASGFAITECSGPDYVAGTWSGTCSDGTAVSGSFQCGDVSEIDSCPNDPGQNCVDITYGPITRKICMTS